MLKTTAKTKADQFWQWLAKAKHGAVYCYHKGHLCFDREPVWLGTRTEAQDAAHIVGLAAMEAEADGRVCLTQRKVEPCRFEYLATKRKRLGLGPSRRAHWR